MNTEHTKCDCGGGGTLSHSTRGEKATVVVPDGWLCDGGSNPDNILMG